METAAAAAGVFSILNSFGQTGAVLALCFLVFAVWLSHKAFRTGRSFRIKIGPWLDFNVDAEQPVSGPQSRKGGTGPTAAEKKATEE
jgi:hypothetical protein